MRISGEISTPSILPARLNVGAVGIDFAVENHLVEIVAGGRALDPPAARGFRLAFRRRDRREREVDVAERQRAGHRLRGIEDLDRAVLEADLRRRVVVELRQRQQAGCAPGAVRTTGHPQRRPANDHPRGLELAAAQIGQIGGASQETFVVAQELGARSFRRGIDDRQPAEGNPFALHQHGRVDLDLQARVLLGKQFLDAAADLFIHAVIEIGHQQRGPDHAGDQAPLEPEPTEVDQALGENGSDSVLRFESIF